MTAPLCGIVDRMLYDFPRLPTEIRAKMFWIWWVCFPVQTCNNDTSTGVNAFLYKVVVFILGNGGGLEPYIYIKLIGRGVYTTIVSLCIKTNITISISWRKVVQGVINMVDVDLVI